MMHTTPQVALRAIEPEDLDLLYSIENSSEVWNIGCSNVPYSRYTLYNYVSNSSADIYADRQVRLIIENAEHVAVGIIDLVNFDPRNRRAELGIVVQKAHRNMGYGSAALCQMCAYACDTLHLHQVYAYVDASNSVSRNMFLGQGFVEGSVMTDWLYDGKAYRDAILMQRYF